MPTPSPLATLAATLATVCQQAQQHQPLLSKNEAATRAALIDPVLRALGWDTSDVSMVEPERTVQNKQSLDYVLKTTSGSILAVIEAKKLGEPLDKLGHVGAVIGYAFSLKPTTFFITDGLNWHGYSPSHSQFEPVVSLRLCAESFCRRRFNCYSCWTRGTAGMDWHKLLFHSLLLSISLRLRKSLCSC